MPTRTLIAHATVFDGTQFLADTSVLFDTTRIVAVGRDVHAAPGDRVVDGRGQTLLPGLIDAHVHTPSMLEFARLTLRDAVRFGVTTVIDLGADPSVVGTMRLRAASTRGLADVRSAGVLATAPHGHPTELGAGLPTINRPEDAAAFVAARKAEGSDYLKLVLEDGRTYGISSPSLDYPTLAALVAAAHDSGLLVVAHAPIQDFARWAIRAGVDVLAHVVVDAPPAEDVVTGLARANMAVISTLTVFETADQHQLWRDVRVASVLAPGFRDRLAEPVPEAFRPRTQIDHGLAAIRAYHRAGVPILAGTDAPNPGTAPGASLHRELQLLARAGLSIPEVMAAATSAPAHWFGLIDRGRIAPGLRPDLVLVAGEVADDLDTTLSIRRVWQRGGDVASRP